MNRQNSILSRTDSFVIRRKKTKHIKQANTNNESAKI